MSVIGTWLRGALGVLALAVSLALVPGIAAAQDTVSGPATTVDADIIFVNTKQRVILWEVDAPERTQECYVGELKWGCYNAARQALNDILATGDVTCVMTPEPPDQFNRRYGVCKIGDLDVGAELIRQGMARAYVAQGSDYLPQEEEARAAEIGLFQPGAKIDDPWEWRKRDPRGYR